jgi:predicted ArsR family transcriptional regulator
LVDAMSIPRRRAISAVRSLDDPARRTLYAFVRRSEAAVSRDDAAAALGMPRSTASFHLDKLVQEGLLAVEFRKLGGRKGPGSGRPSKLYRPTESEIAVSVPQRRYDLAAELMAAAIEETMRTGGNVQAAMERLAHDAGVRLGQEAEDLIAALEANGYEPIPREDGGYVLGNCPFHRLSRSHSGVVCALNGGLLQGAVEGSCDSAHVVVPDPDGPHCCARLEPRRSEVTAPDRHSRGGAAEPAG